MPTYADAQWAALGDRTRRTIFTRIARRPCAVGELARDLPVSRPAVSQHLKVLRDAGLVTPRKEGRSRLYRVEAEPLRAVYDWAAHFERFWTHRLDALGALLDREAAIERKGGRS